MSDKKLDILVVLRETCDPRPPARLTADGYSIRDRGLRRIANPADLCALEKALQLAERSGGRVTAAAVGPERLDDHLRLALSMGAERVIRVWDGSFAGGDAVSAARPLERLIEILKPDLTLSGNRLADRGAEPSLALAAARLGIPYVTAALAADCREQSLEVVRKSDRGARQRVGATLPALLLCEEGCCEPRYPDQEALMKASQAEVARWGCAELGISPVGLGESGATLEQAKCSFPRSNPQRVVTPDATLPAFERILALLSGGLKPREGKLHQLGVDQTVDQLVETLRAEGLIGGGRG